MKTIASFGRFAALCLIAFGIAACDGGNKGGNAADSGPYRVEVRHYGALRKIMHEADLSAHFSLDSVSRDLNSFGLGAAENLKGELMLWQGKTVYSAVEDSHLVVHKGRGRKAALWVEALVPEWKALPVAKDITDPQALEAFIGKTILKSGLDTSAAVPFLLTGACKSAEWHVIDWPEGDTVHTHEKHKSSGLHGRLEGEELRIIGFFSRHHAGVFTHHSTALHMHLWCPAQDIAGHVDALDPSGMELSLPVRPAKGSVIPAGEVEDHSEE